MASSLAEIQFSIHEWYPTWPVAGRLATVATSGGVDLDATLLVPIAVAADTGLPLATTSVEVAESPRPTSARSSSSDGTPDINRAGDGCQRYDATSVPDSTPGGQSSDVSVSWPARTAPAVTIVSGRTRKCWVTAWTSRRRRCSGLVAYSDVPPPAR